MNHDDAGFNPLHCGAVVASGLRHARHGEEPPVSIPFIAGQWSLPGGVDPAPIRRRRVSIPFIAGQWSLPIQPRPAEGGRGLFQSPSLRGSGRFDKKTEK